jgi:hypothetical protein
MLRAMQNCRSGPGRGKITLGILQSSGGPGEPGIVEGIDGRLNLRYLGG